MTDNLQITLNGLPQSRALEARIRERAAKLDRRFGPITSCRVVIEQPHHHSRQGGQFSVRLLVNVPGAEFVVNHGHDEDVYVAVRGAFDKARRQLDGYAQKRDGGGKSGRAARPA